MGQALDSAWGHEDFRPGEKGAGDAGGSIRGGL